MIMEIRFKYNIIFGFLIILISTKKKKQNKKNPIANSNM